MDAYEYVLKASEESKKFNVIILDPPYNVRKSREKYEGRWIGSFTKIKDVLSSIIIPGGVIITFGYDTTGMSKKRGFALEEILIINHSGDHNDTLGIIERFNNHKITEYAREF